MNLSMNATGWNKMTSSGEKKGETRTLRGEKSCALGFWRERVAERPMGERNTEVVLDGSLLSDG